MRLALIPAALALLTAPALALDKPDVTYKVFQFPADKIPRVDGDPHDWDMVPDSYVVGTDQLRLSLTKKDPRKNLDIRVKVGWVKGINRLYFLYEAEDDYWDFAQPGLHNDTFEVIVDGDASGGPLIDKEHRESWTPRQVGESAAKRDARIRNADAHWAIHGVHAQNYHIFTPAVDKDWTMAWGSPTWIKELPFANAATSYHFRPGESGKLILEFWITPFDYAGPEGPWRAVESILSESKIIGLSWAVLDYDDPNGEKEFRGLSTTDTMFGHASELCAFRLMPMEPSLLPKLAAQWSWRVVDLDRRLVSFKDLSIGKVTSWKWTFGDGATSTEQYPEHVFARPGMYVTTLEVSGPDGTARRAKVWDVQLK